MTEIKKPPTYRWSPKPVEETLRKGTNQWCLALTTAQWNIVWLVNPKIATEEASAAWREALGQSWNCLLAHDGHLGTHTLLEWGEWPASTVATVLRFTGEWVQPPPILRFDPRWKVNWPRRAKLARQDHPWALNTTMNTQVTNVYHARKLLQDLGFVKEFKDNP